MKAPDAGRRASCLLHFEDRLCEHACVCAYRYKNILEPGNTPPVLSES